MQPSGIITLMSDFGLDDFFVAAMKGVVLSINRTATVIDITHTVSAHDIFGAALTLADCYAAFPEGTIHVAVVDPGVGSERRPILVESDRYFFVGPDNGLFSFIYEAETIRRVIHITAHRFFRQPVSRTFHGRDIFAPCAARLSEGVDPREFGEPITDPVKLTVPTVEPFGEKRLRGQVIHVDRFGNLITNLTAREVPLDLIQSGGALIVGGREVSAIRTHYGEGREGEVFAVIGSTGRVEISLYRGSAATILGVDRGAVVELVFP
jgi:hypothetical protein